MPDTNILNKKFADTALSYCKTNKFISKNGGKILTVIGVFSALNMTLIDYNRIIKETSICKPLTIKMYGSLILKALLKKFPDTLKKLEENNLYNPIS